MEIIVDEFNQAATASAAQFTPNFQNFAEALASAAYVFDMIERVNEGGANYSSLDIRALALEDRHY